MKYFQNQIKLKPFSRGFHLITGIVVKSLPEIKDINVGMLYVFVKHTSASLTINENADSSVRTDLESHLNKMVPENAPYYLHNYEGSDDMPAHIKAMLTTTTLSIPIVNNRLALGVWQGVFLWEHRRMRGNRRLVIHVGE